MIRIVGTLWIVANLFETRAAPYYLCNDSKRPALRAMDSIFHDWNFTALPAVHPLRHLPEHAIDISPVKSARCLPVCRDEVLLCIPHVPQNDIQFRHGHAVAVELHSLQYLNQLLDSLSNDAEGLRRGDLS